MKVNVWNTIVQLSKERGVDTSVIIAAITESLRVASRKYFTNDEKINIFFQPEKGELRVYTIKKIVEKPENPATEISLAEAKKIDATASLGNYIEIDLPSDTLGRIAARAAKHVILQKVRNAEQEKIYQEFAPRLGEIVTGILRRFEANQNMIIEVNKTDVLLPYREKLPHEEFRRGDRVKGVITHVFRENTGPQVIISRTNPKFLYKLLELEIPEIANKTIFIKHIVRQPGERAKVAVFTQDENVDPVGSCIGVKGNRIMAISKELNGEKIDIIKWSDNPLEYARAALSPAKVSRVFILNKHQKILQAVVPENQYSLAIGKKGTNVRLASKLVGWTIKIKKD
ncbi:MAG: transcription termination factor NusA [Candidatus Aminicenantes bacterium]|nr:transcription termination factor NusA [Candidatus Aminicenantes bacterium]RLE01760.1 MAG: transcription termination factor NusA [Candidatus Aminicenantes bacterium]RLE03410.1 MAG: transcription termination factor NusA [Candidatus Aminicenantes bacterium]HHF42793.1 transcription termination factor NusA [Candidatus Aminicenantes bacterium]